ncbi:hypothetical protein EJ02DRAFT_62767 [Clathrospora elynae]|uniref:Secreted protein n=1 Tax=Clathrospora elynae TaxID=706981 RepID=A0A6A5SC98_9PLEO|nr:hypothetical protein EJ02DRAFT_62767 [Clathrospora elynae]
MHSTALFSALLASTVCALSLPPLIRLILGVTEPLSENAPLLPILQVPTPPLTSPPHLSIGPGMEHGEMRDVLTMGTRALYIC